MAIFLHAAPAGSGAKAVVRADPRTHRLVPVVVAPPRTAESRTSAAGVLALAAESADRHGVDPLLVQSVMQTESDFEAAAVSPKGALGLMQLMPATARRFGVADAFDPGDNIEGGVKYLKYLRDLFHDDRLAVAAYNAGENAVLKYKGVPPYPETKNYVAKVSGRYEKAKARKAERGDTRPAITAEERHPALAEFVDASGRLHITAR